MWKGILIFFFVLAVSGLAVENRGSFKAARFGIRVVLAWTP
jgi:hypothetical protein